MDTASKIFIAGHRGMVGSAIVRQLEAQGYSNLLLKNRGELDLTSQLAVESFFAAEKPDYVFLSAAKVGGIHANNEYPAEFIYQNLMIQNNIIHASYNNGVKSLLFLGSSCIYPKDAEQPMSEDALLTGVLEPTNEPYAIAKIAGIKMCESYNRQYSTDFRAAMPTNLYGPHDNFHLENSHVIPALIRKFHEAKVNGSESVGAWGTGKACREFLHVDEMAAACLFLMQLKKGEFWKAIPERCSHVNVGTGTDVSIKELTGLVKEVTDFQGEIHWDTSKPDGTLRKLMSATRLAEMGFESKLSLRDGLISTYQWFLDNQGHFRS
jgi:GDP-L-fucose synthase